MFWKYFIEFFLAKYVIIESIVFISKQKTVKTLVNQINESFAQN
jgi:hypothetical protein